MACWSTVPVPGLARTDLLGRVHGINIASWCGPCRLEHADGAGEDARIRRRYQYKDQPENAAVSSAASATPMRRSASTPRAAIDWGVYGVPETFLVSADGVIRLKHIGPLTPEALRDRLMPEIEKALGG
jgi:cytochrome c biogenesis protein CcmG/thiol:disulfide interchange protein DsbE